MKLTFDIHTEDKEEIFSFDLAKAFYNICNSSLIDVKTVANMMLLEAKNIKELGIHNE